MNIAMVCDPITDYIAGVFVSTLRFAELLQAAGHKVVFIAAKSPHSAGVNDYKGIPIYRFRSVLLPKSEKRFRLAFPTVGEIENILREEKIDILHTLLPTPVTAISIRAARNLGVKIVVHSHAQPENIFLHVPKIFGRDILSNIFDRYLHRLYGGADALVYPTEFARAFFPKLNARIKNVTISNGVNLDIFRPQATEKFFAEHDLPRGTKNVLFVGRLHPEKNIETLIKAMPKVMVRHDDARLWIVGPGHLKDKLRELVGRLGIGGKTKFFGKVSAEDLVLSYNACDVFVLPSLAELEGMVVLEAMACGKPIIIADSKGSASIYFVNGNGSLFRPEDHEDLADQIIAKFDNDELRAKMGRASLAIAKDYDIKHSVAKLEALYHSII